MRLAGKILIFIALGALTSCYYDNEEDLYPHRYCDTTAVSYLNDIVPPFRAHCYSCHDKTNALAFGGGILIDDYAEVLKYVKDSSLYGSMEWLEPWSPMPPDYKILLCDRLKLKAWINQGYKNN